MTVSHSDENIAFHCELGLAIAQWSHVERQLIGIALDCIHDHKDKSAFAISYHSIENFRSKLSVCDNLVVHTHKKSRHLQAWKDARAQTAGLSAKRNKIAHGWHKVYLGNTAGRRWALVPIHFSDGELYNLQGEKPPPGALCLRDIASIRMEFHALTTRLCNVRELLAGRRAPFPASFEQAENPPTIHTIRNLIRVALGWPQKSLRASRKQKD